jgi:three-Cys-motif partner protein
MGRKHREEHFEEFAPHTLLKHGVLSRYAVIWTNILTQKHPRVWLVDGFAGRGKDEAGNPGSPLLLAIAAEKMRPKADVQLLAIEEDRKAFEALKANLAAFDADAGGMVPIAHLRHGTLSEVADEAFQLVGESPAFFFLDPFGPDGLSLDVVRQILAKPRREVFALFSQSGVLRHLGALTKDNTGETLRAHVKAPGLFTEHEPEWVAEALAAAEDADANLAPNREAAARILRELFGSDEKVWEIAALPRRRWGQEAVRAYLDVLESCGGHYKTAIAVLDERQRCAYYLVHAARDPLAALKMKEAAVSALRASDLPDKTKHSFRLLHSGHIPAVAAALKAHFGSQVVDWRTGKGEGPDCVRGWALRETALFPTQGDDLQDALKAIRVAGRKVRYDFGLIA